MDDPYCPICGKKKGDDEILIAAAGCKQHRCDEAFLRDRDETMAVTFRMPAEPSFFTRLCLGFQMLDDEGKSVKLR